MAYGAARSRRTALAALLLLTALVYAPIRGASFVYEDDNWIAGLETAPALTLPSRSLTYLTQHWTWTVVGLEPSVFHLVNVGLHLVNGLLLFAVARQLVSSAAALVAMFVFLCHPLNSQAVNYVTGRADLLMTTWVLLATWMVLAQPLRLAWLWVPALGLAAMSKEIGLVGVPLVLLTLAIWRPAVTPSRRALAGLALSVGLLVGLAAPFMVRWLTMRPGWGGSGLPWLEFAAIQQAFAWRYALMTVWPTGFSIDHDYLAMTEFWRLVAGVASALLVGLVFVAWERGHRLVVWSAIWMAVALLPRIVVGSSEFLTEHQLYLPFAGVSILLGSAAAHLWAWTPRLTERTA